MGLWLTWESVCHIINIEVVQDKAEGAFHETKGKVKEMAGKIGDNPELEAEGTDEKIAGKVQKKVGQGKKFLGK